VSFQSDTSILTVYFFRATVSPTSLIVELSGFTLNTFPVETIPEPANVATSTLTVSAPTVIPVPAPTARAEPPPPVKPFPATDVLRCVSVTAFAAISLLVIPFVATLIPLLVIVNVEPSVVRAILSAFTTIPPLADATSITFAV